MSSHDDYWESIETADFNNNKKAKHSQKQS